MCGTMALFTGNMHMDHVDRKLKAFDFSKLLHKHTSMPNMPVAGSYVPRYSGPRFATVYNAFFAELKNAAVLCTICHARKTFAENEIICLLKLLNSL